MGRDISNSLDDNFVV